MCLRRCIWISSGLTALLAIRPVTGVAAETVVTTPMVPATPQPAPAAAVPTPLMTPAQPRGPQAEDSSDEDSSDEDADDLRALVADEGERSRINVAACVGTGVTVALLGVAAFFAASASGKEGDVNRLITYRNETTGIPLEYGTVATSFEDDVRIGRRDNRLAKGFALAAAATALVSTALFVIDALRGPPPASESKRAANAQPAFFLSGDSHSTPAGVFGLAWRLP